MGALNVQNRGAAAAVVSRLIGVTKAKRRRPLTIAKGKLNIRPGVTARIKAKLTRRGKNAVRRRKRSKLYANVTLARKLVLSSPITLKKQSSK
jgi:hypothetical protein